MKKTLARPYKQWKNLYINSKIVEFKTKPRFLYKKKKIEVSETFESREI